MNTIYEPISYKNSRSVGAIGEAAALYAFTKAQIPIYTGFNQNSPVDFVVQINNTFLKVQVKTTERIKNGAMEFCISRTNGFTARSIPYAPGEIDIFVLYCIENNWIGLINYYDAPKRGITIRIGEKPEMSIRKNQYDIKYSSEYDFYTQIENLKKISSPVQFVYKF